SFPRLRRGSRSVMGVVVADVVDLLSPRLHRLFGDHGAGDSGRGREDHHQARAVHTEANGNLHQTRSAWYPASCTAANTAASSTDGIVFTTSLPVSALTSIPSTPTICSTSSRTDISQCPHVMPTTW